MRTSTILALLLMLGAAAGPVRRCEAGALRRAYFRAATADARQRVAPFAALQLPGGIVCAEIPPAMLPTLSAAPGLTFLGYEALYHPAPIATEELRGEPPRTQAAADLQRPCTLPSWIPAVGWGIKTMYDDPQLLRPSGGAGVRIGVIDTGVSPHLDLVRRLVKCVNLSPSDLLPPCADSMNHGTLVASVIAADGGADGLGMWGMAPEASLYSYRVCEPNRECWGSYVADGIYAAIADSVNIINMSLDGPGHDEAIRAAIDDAIAHNILVVVAAGNSPPYSYVAYPASYPEVVSVGAIRENLQPWAYSASGVNDGDYVRESNEIEVAAPGAEVLAALKSGCWVLGSGTSLAAPLVTGLAAKLWNGDAAATRARLQRAARFRDLYVAGDDTLTGFGLPTTRDFSGSVMVTATAGPGGTVNPSGVVLGQPGATQPFTIVPADECHAILDVTVDGVSRGPVSSYTFPAMRSDHTLRATFTGLGPFTLVAGAGVGGTIGPSGAASVPCGESRSYTISATPGCNQIQDVKVDGVSQGPISSYTFAHVRSDHTIQAEFTPVGAFTYTITASAGAGGTISPSGAADVPCGESRSYTIRATPGCNQIEDVKVDGVSQGAISTYTFTNVAASHAISATFSTGITYALIASDEPGGTISPIGLVRVPCGVSQTYTIAPDSCHTIERLIVDGVARSPSPTYTFSNVRSNHTILATFSWLGSYAISASASPGGTISPVGTSSVGCGGSRTYVIAPADDCHGIQDVKVDGVSRGPLSSYTFAAVSSHHTIEATFALLAFTLAAGAGPGGTITPAGASRATCGESRSYIIAPADKCHAIQDVTVDGVSQGPVSAYTFGGVSAGHTIQATFSALGPFTIEAGVAPGATIRPSGAASVACGGSQSYTIGPEDACRVIHDVQVDGASVGAVDGYTFRDVQGPHTISASSTPSDLKLAESHTGASFGGIADGAIDLAVTGGVPPYSYAWSNGATAQDLAALTAGTYDVQVTDAQGCAGRLSVAIVNLGPAEPALSRPAPNPTSGSLRVRYGVPAPSVVRLSVLDLQGREIAVLAEGSQPPGWSWATWNGETGSGRAPGGLYFIRLRAGGRQVVQRFALVR